MSASGVDPRRVERADVYKAGALAAQLVRREGGTEFAYRPEYLDIGPAVATTLPLAEEPVRAPAGAVPPFFAGLLPEGRRLSALRRHVKTSADDDLSLLLAVGADPVGDVQVVPAGATPEVPKQPLLLDSDWSDVDFAEVLEGAGIDPVALAGVQDKASGRMLTVPLVYAGRAHLLKLDPPEYAGVVVDEDHLLKVARSLRQRVVQAQVVHDRAGRPGLLVERFDREPEGSGLRALPVEDGAQLLGRYPADKYAVTTEELLAGIGRVCAARAVAVRAVLQQVAFAWLTGNGDLHAKNVSVLGVGRVARSNPMAALEPPTAIDRSAHAPTGTPRSGPHATVAGSEWRVAPIYDIPSTVPYGDKGLALSIAGRTDSLSRKRFLNLAAQSGVPVAAAERVLSESLRATADVADGIVEAMALDAGRARTLRRVLGRRWSDLSG